MARPWVTHVSMVVDRWSPMGNQWVIHNFAVGPHGMPMGRLWITYETTIVANGSSTGHPLRCGVNLWLVHESPVVHS